MKMGLEEYKMTVEDFDFSNPPIDPSDLAMKLVSKMKEMNVIGLSGRQIGYPYNVFAIEAEPIFVCFNAKVVQPSEEQVLLEETDMNYPGIIMKVSRPRHIRCRFVGPDGDTYTKTFTGMSARVFQQQVDICNGKNIFTSASPLKLKMALNKAKKSGYNYDISKLRGFGT